VRCELIVAWTAQAAGRAPVVRISLDGDRDEISLDAYQRADSGIEQRGLLVAAPKHRGTVPLVIELVRDNEEPLRAAGIELEITSDPHALKRVADELVQGVSPRQAARRIAWLREQQMPRLSTGYLHAVLRALARGKLKSESVGRNVHRLRWNARLAAFEPMPGAIRDAEAAAVRSVIDACPEATRGDEGLADRVVCLGRAVDELRRLGYLGTVARMASLGRELHVARAQIARLPLVARYRVLVGLTLADPGDLGLQRELLRVRHDVAALGEFPAL
jgi:hypothetical protein